MTSLRDQFEEMIGREVERGCAAVDAPEDNKRKLRQLALDAFMCGVIAVTSEPWTLQRRIEAQAFIDQSAMRIAAAKGPVH